MTPLPPSVHVFVRDWLSANNVLLRSDDGPVLIDSGYVRHAPLTLALLRSPHGIGDTPLAAVVNTHCHSDHMGGNATLARAYGCPIWIPEGEGSAVAVWDHRALLLNYAGQSADRFSASRLLRAGERHLWGGLEWIGIEAPGHDMGALCFFNPEHGILISGDALWEHGFGFVMPPEFDPAALPATRATLETLARLPVRVVIPGHGDPFDDVGAALERAFARLRAYEADPTRLAWYALKVVLMFCVLDRRSLALNSVPALVAQVGLYRDFNDRFFRLSPTDLASRLVSSLVASGAARVAEARLEPASRAR